MGKEETEKKQIIFLEPWSEIMTYKIARLFKKNGYSTYAIRILESKGLSDNFFKDAFDEIISFNVNFYKINPQNLWAIHDDIDLPLGKIRISHNSSAAGHKGIQSTIDELGTQEFVRFRIGIKPATPTKVPTEKYVLQKIAKADKVIVAEAIRMVLAAMEVSLAQGLTEAMNEFN